MIYVGQNRKDFSLHHEGLKPKSYNSRHWGSICRTRLTAQIFWQLLYFCTSPLTNKDHSFTALLWNSYLSWYLYKWWVSQDGSCHKSMYWMSWQSFCSSEPYFSWSFFWINSASFNFSWASWSSLNRAQTCRFRVSTSLPTFQRKNYENYIWTIQDSKVTGWER